MNFKLNYEIAFVLLLAILSITTGDFKVLGYGLVGALAGYLFSQCEEDCD